MQGWFNLDSHVENQMIVYGLLDPKEKIPSLSQGQLTLLQIRVAHFRMLVCHTFAGSKDMRYFRREAASNLLAVLDEGSSSACMAKYGRAFIHTYHYAKWAAEGQKNLSVESWITSGSSKEVCLSLFCKTSS